jgi:hypothetical protein
MSCPLAYFPGRDNLFPEGRGTLVKSSGAMQGDDGEQ